MSVILPGATIGILGNGQLGRMTALAARAMGYRVAVIPEDRESPAGQVADRPFSEAQVLTYEFENVEPISFDGRVVPPWHVLTITQNRLREKTWLRDNGIPVTPFREITGPDSFDGFAYPAVLKTAGFGYDGKGQQKVASAEEARAAWDGTPSILEQFIPFRREVSVVAARSQSGEFAHYGVIENRHRNHILDVSFAPAAGAEQAPRIAREIFEKMGVVGVLCTEFFETADGQLLVNEMAPRPHNSGHLTIEAAACSQFEQAVRAACGLPLGSTEMRPAAMANLLGDEWYRPDGTIAEPNWRAALEDRRVKLHLYGKAEPRRARKMGHLTAVAASVEEAVNAVVTARERLR